MSAQPWMKFYPRDWRGDQALRAISIAARGLWMEMLCIMHEASPYGHLILGGRAVSSDILARIAGLSMEESDALLVELESAGVFSRTRKGVIYSRRMIKDHSRAEKGRKSVNKRWKQGSENKEENAVPNRVPNTNPTTQKPEARDKTKAKALAKTAMPDGWQPSPFTAGTNSRRIEQGWTPAERRMQFEAFAAHHAKNGSKWADWQSAWAHWVLNSEKFDTPVRARPAEPTSFLEYTMQRQAGGRA